jgi:hypothetical protein
MLHNALPRRRRAAATRCGKEDFVNEGESLRRYGLHPVGGDLDEVRDMLTAQAAREQQRQGDGDTELMKLCSVQLFNAGVLTDVLLIWQAKESSWDAHCSIEVQLLCGAGLEATMAYLTTEGSLAGSAALEYLRQCQASGDFAAFSVENQSQWYSQYYGPRMTHSDKQQVIAVLEQLVSQWGAGPPADWENTSIPEYLEAMAAWLRSYERAYLNMGEPVPADGWAVFAQALRAAVIYE